VYGQPVAVHRASYALKARIVSFGDLVSRARSFATPAGRPNRSARFSAARSVWDNKTVRRRLRLRSLTPELRAAFDQGRITANVAEVAARLPEPEQKELADELVQQGRLTLPSVRHVARERSIEAKAELPDELFCNRELPWQAIVCGHIAAALSALPDDNRPGQLAAS
jgi:hypothetical protein